MNIIPVIDLLAGQVVRGIGGRRDEYRPLESPLAKSAEPVDVALGLRRRFGFREMYVADLDAITGRGSHWPVLQGLPLLDWSVWVDGGFRSTADVHQLLTKIGPQAQRITIVAGLETVEGPMALAAICQRCGPERVIFSLDLKQGRTLANKAFWSGTSPEELAAEAYQAGVRRMIVLDLADVGESRGVGTIQLCQSLGERYPDLELTAGGGVRGLDDLRALHEAGCVNALIASALHNGSLTPEDVVTAAMWD